MNDKELFKTVLNRLSDIYYSRNIAMDGTLVYVDGECKFNTDGFSLLYNLKRLCEVLEEELR